MKKRRSLIVDKSGEIGDTMYPVIIRALVYLLFFSAILYFVYKSATGALVYEQAYAKEIGLMLDKARPGTTFSIDFEKALEVAEKNDALVERIVEINSELGYVKIRLANEGGYEFRFFNNYKIENEIDEENKRLIIRVVEELA